MHPVGCVCTKEYRSNTDLLKFFMRYCDVLGPILFSFPNLMYMEYFHNLIPSICDLLISEGIRSSSLWGPKSVIEVASLLSKYGTTTGKQGHHGDGWTDTFVCLSIHSSITFDKAFVYQIRVNTNLTLNRIKSELLCPWWLPHGYHVGSLDASFHYIIEAMVGTVWWGCARLLEGCTQLRKGCPRLGRGAHDCMRGVHASQRGVHGFLWSIGQLVKYNV